MIQIKRKWIKHETSPLTWEVGHNPCHARSTGGFFHMEARIESLMPLELTVFLKCHIFCSVELGTFDSVDAAIAEAERLMKEAK